MVYYLFALFSGFIVIFNVIINSRLAKKTDIFLSTLVNYCMGFLTSLIIVIALRETVSLQGTTTADVPFIYYLGGVFGVAVVTIFNIVVHKIPVIYTTILSFIGQLFMGIVLDLIIGNMFSLGKILGLVLISAGFLYNMSIDKKITEPTSGTIFFL